MGSFRLAGVRGLFMGATPSRVGHATGAGAAVTPGPTGTRQPKAGGYCRRMKRRGLSERLPTAAVGDEEGEVQGVLRGGIHIGKLPHGRNTRRSLLPKTTHIKVF